MSNEGVVAGKPKGSCRFGHGNAGHKKHA